MNEQKLKSINTLKQPHCWAGRILSPLSHPCSANNRSVSKDNKESNKDADIMVKC
jgi:hypothetical protein